MRNEFVLRLFLLPALEPREAHAVLRQIAADSETMLGTLREEVESFDATAQPGAMPAMNRLVAEYGLRSFETLHQWALWALDRSGQASAPGPA